MRARSGSPDRGRRARRTRRTAERRYSDRGSATVWSVAALAVLCVVFGVVLALGQAVVTRHRAAGGADLAALAAAYHWAEGPAAACARADRAARAQGTRLVRCALVGDISDVTAASGRGPFAAEVRARAGPAEAGPETGVAGSSPGVGVAGSSPRVGVGLAGPGAETRPAEAGPETRSEGASPG
ncbi:Rv3654c family TadE-like protein [Streptomyces sp. TRM68416]|uniref:Rv3654c family TadE-like protein n=1 Tax=Streptomyces sp. TRM68416 TaxID=2758412 RepID=UPI001661B378|nr:Rv3654c family TadE-like protein [Streptomyces sp. TRM68416]MBD0838831.1 flp pilus-assembly TadE/G-like family protein [Streptomyces sp. TRM68416]